VEASNLETSAALAPAAAQAEAAGVRKLANTERGRLAEALARAFYDDPVMSWFYPRDSRRLEQLEGLFGYFGDRFWFEHEETYTTPGLLGGAIWLPPDQWRVGLLDQLRAMPGFAAATGLRDLPRGIRGFNLMESKHPHEPHWYLPVVGVDPPAQGKGLGTALLQPILRRCDQEGVPAYLEATSPRSRACYERNGFEVTGELRFPDGPPLWLMWREPGPARAP
jgi:RimJ/RimL family protein N-acetyltransferase